ILLESRLRKSKGRAHRRQDSGAQRLGTHWEARGTLVPIFEQMPKSQRHCDGQRATPRGINRGARLAAARSGWEALARGLPHSERFETLLRDGMATDSLAPAGICLATAKCYWAPAQNAQWWREAKSAITTGLGVTSDSTREWCTPPNDGQRTCDFSAGL